MSHEEKITIREFKKTLELIFTRAWIARIYGYSLSYAIIWHEKT